MRCEKQRHPTKAHIAAPEALAIARVYLWVGEEVANALDVDDDLSAARLLKREVREGVRSVAHDLVGDETRVRAVLGEGALEVRLDRVGQVALRQP